MPDSFLNATTLSEFDEDWKKYEEQYDTIIELFLSANIDDSETIKLLSDLHRGYMYLASKLKYIESEIAVNKQGIHRKSGKTVCAFFVGTLKWLKKRISSALKRNRRHKGEIKRKKRASHDTIFGKFRNFKNSVIHRYGMIETTTNSELLSRHDPRNSMQSTDLMTEFTTSIGMFIRPDPEGSIEHSTERMRYTAISKDEEQLQEPIASSFDIILDADKDKLPFLYTGILKGRYSKMDADKDKFDGIYMYFNLSENAMLKFSILDTGKSDLLSQNNKSDSRKVIDIVQDIRLLNQHYFTRLAVLRLRQNRLGNEYTEELVSKLTISCIIIGLVLFIGVITQIIAYALSLYPNISWLCEDDNTHNDEVLQYIYVRGRRKTVLHSRYWMVTMEMFMNAIRGTASVSDLYFTVIFPTNCRMPISIPSFVGSYIQEKDITGDVNSVLSMPTEDNTSRSLPNNHFDYPINLD